MNLYELGKAFCFYGGTTIVSLIVFAIVWFEWNRRKEVKKLEEK